MGQILLLRSCNPDAHRGALMRPHQSAFGRFASIVIQPQAEIHGDGFPYVNKHGVVRILLIFSLKMNLKTPP